MKKPKVAKKVYITPNGESNSATADATALRFTFGNGEVRMVEFGDLPENIMQTASRHGISQKLGDSYASALTVADAIEALDDTIAQVRGGDWNTRLQAGVTKLARLCLAVQRVTGGTTEDITEKVMGLSETDREALAKSPQVVAALAAIEAERKATKAANSPGVDLKSLLNIK